MQIIRQPLIQMLKWNTNLTLLILPPTVVIAVVGGIMMLLMTLTDFKVTLTETGFWYLVSANIILIPLLTMVSFTGARLTRSPAAFRNIEDWVLSPVLLFLVPFLIISIWSPADATCNSFVTLGIITVLWHFAARLLTSVRAALLRLSRSI